MENFFYYFQMLIMCRIRAMRAAKKLSIKTKEEEEEEVRINEKIISS